MAHLNQKKKEDLTEDDLTNMKLLEDAAKKLKDKVLFPERIEQAKEFLSKVKRSDL